MSTEFYKVALVVDRTFGERLLGLAHRFHVWIVDSPINTPVIQQVWNTERSEDNAGFSGPGVTSFKAGDEELPHDMCVRIVEDIDEHHGEFSQVPPWSEIAVYGTTLSDELRDVFSEFGATEILPVLSGGFICRR